MNNTTRRLFMLRVYACLRVPSPLTSAGPACAFIWPLTNTTITITTSYQNPHLSFNIAAANSRTCNFSTASTSSQSIDGAQTRTATPLNAATITSNHNSNVSSSSSNINPVLQRYSQLMDSGCLKPDAQQLTLVQELARLYDEICIYKTRMDEYHRATAEHQARRLKRLQELLADEAREEEEGEQQRHREGQEVKVAEAGQYDEREPRRRRSRASGTESDSVSMTASPSSFLSLGSWFVNSVVAPLTRGSSEAGGRGAAAASDSPLVRARQAAIRREERLQREIGPPPSAPEPPKGMYVWGSVGSGKSMLMAMFYQALMETAQLPATRWMHFNAAMLEVHSRLHYLDTERWRQRDERERRHHHHQQQKQRQEDTTQDDQDQKRSRAEQKVGSQMTSQQKRRVNSIFKIKIMIRGRGKGGRGDGEEEGEKVSATAALQGAEAQQEWRWWRHWVSG
ncbi:hypothetical protein Vretifemale_9250 [Volvox reticuliferus]|uniref:Orc1-like AAA ATPase domain-containing protein n=1 Tax=Volvox reticuliferus TaxID=1737510 RepID=A0A8J4CFL4_9CHLO|nr:hypothetical protein Vretifemale_9250 [Volvox reticuliferus]